MHGATFGSAVFTDMIFGEFSPSGRLAYTVYKESWAAATPMTDMSLQAGQGRTYKWHTQTPTFAFGAGISYTKFAIAIVLRPAQGSGAGSHSYDVTVTNTGKVAAAEVVLVFAAVLKLAKEPSELRADLPAKQLCAFDRTPVLAPGASVSATFRSPLRPLQIADLRLDVAAAHAQHYHPRGGACLDRVGRAAGRPSGALPPGVRGEQREGPSGAGHHATH